MLFVHMSYLGLTLLALSSPVLATPHPVLTDPKIVSCEDYGPMAQGPCSHKVKYNWGPVVLIDLPEVAPPVWGGSTELIAVGMHCDRGNMLTGAPFSSCRWGQNPGHNPTLSNCRLKSTASWELTVDSTCDISEVESSQFHSGAGPGGECVVFVQSGQYNSNPGPLSTIHGVLTPTTVANSGNRFCQKPVPPAVTCSFTVPSTIDHGVVGPNSTSTAYVDGDVRCGLSPVVSVVGGDVLHFAPGVTGRVSARLTSVNRIQITSDLRTTDGTPGAHSASVVVMMSPY